jgi:hypothetical protein
MDKYIWIISHYIISSSKNQVFYNLKNIYYNN